MSLYPNWCRGFTTALAFCIVSTASVNAQEPTKNDPARRATEQYEATGQSQQDPKQDMQKIGKAYQELHQAALNALQQKASSWSDKSGAGSTGIGTDPDRSGTPDRDRAGTGSDSDRVGSTGRVASSNSGAQTLRGQDLLIAASADGLLAGAPSAKTSGIDADRGSRPSKDPDADMDRGNDRGRDRDADKADRPDSHRNADRAAAGRSAVDRAFGTKGGAAEGDSVGMLLVCAYSDDASGSAGRRPTSIGSNSDDMDSDRERSAREASGTRDGAMAGSKGGRLEPGIYCIKQSGSTIWLANEKGETFLKTTIDSSHGAGQYGRDKAAGDDDRAGTDPYDSAAKDRDDMRDTARASGMGRGAKNDPEWEYIFGAITKEAMTHMGWAHQGATRRGE